jgi:hypothetical protein
MGEHKYTTVLYIQLPSCIVDLDLTCITLNESQCTLPRLPYAEKCDAEVSFVAV